MNIKKKKNTNKKKGSTRPEASLPLLFRFFFISRHIASREGNRRARESGFFRSLFASHTASAELPSSFLVGIDRCSGASAYREDAPGVPPLGLATHTSHLDREIGDFPALLLNLRDKNLDNPSAISRISPG